MHNNASLNILSTNARCLVIHLMDFVSFQSPCILFARSIVIFKFWKVLRGSFCIWLINFFFPFFFFLIDWWITIDGRFLSLIPLTVLFMPVPCIHQSYVIFFITISNRYYKRRCSIKRTLFRLTLNFLIVIAKLETVFFFSCFYISI